MPFHIQFVFNRADYVALSLALAKRSMVNRLIWVLAVAAYLFFGSIGICLLSGMSFAAIFSSRVLIPDWFGGGMPRWMSILFLLALLSPFYRHYWVLLHAYFRFNRRRRGDIEAELTVNDDGIGIKQPGIAGHLDWALIQRIIETPRHLFLVVDFAQALTLPRRVFANEAAYQSALSFIKSKTKPDISHVIF